MYIYIYIYVYIYTHTLHHSGSEEKSNLCHNTLYNTGWRGPIGCLIFISHFLQKSPIISGSLTERDLQLRASYGSSQFFLTYLGRFLQTFLYMSFPANEPYN